MIEVTMCNFGPECIITFEADDRVPIIEFNKVLSSSLYPSKPIEIVKEVEVVKEVEKEVEKTVEVPTEVVKEIEVVKEVEKIICADGQVVSSMADCPLTKENIKQKLALAGVIGFASAGFIALIAYYYKKGKEKQAHKMLDSFISKRKK